ncbi:MAG: acyltransferase family protein [Pseudomonadota bacterium]|nr:acyltransferase family protein [Pseudomonadota bacterium]
MSSSAYRPDIDGLRCIAVMSVLLAHAGVSAFPGGYLGVDVFFVISGFLITGLIRKGSLAGEFSFREFYMRRLRRLAPAMLVTLAITFVIFALIMPPPDLKRLAQSTAFSVLSVANVYFYLKVGYFDTEAAFKPLLHMWSLGVEEQFYLIWPVTAWAVLRWGRRLFWPLVMVLTALSFLAAEYAYDLAPAAVYYLLPFRAGELLIGALALWAVDHVPARRRLAEAALTAGLALIAFSVLILDETARIPGLIALAPCLGAALALWAGGSAPGVGRILTNRPAVWIGTISYSLYLVHWPVMVFWRFVTSHAWSLPEQMALIGACVILAFGLHRWVETPFRRMPPEGARLRPNLGFLAGTAALAALCLAPGAAERTNRFHDWFDVAPARAFEATADVSATSRPATVALDGGRSARVRRYEAEGEEVHALLLGDSHSNALLPGLSRLLPQHGISLDSSSQAACPPLFGMVPRSAEPERRPDDRACVRRLPEWRELAVSDEYDVVVLASRWGWLVEPETTNGVEFPRRALTSPDTPELLPDLDVARRNFREALRTTVEELRSGGKRVILISQAPPPGISTGRCTALIDGGEDAGRCRRLDDAGMASRAAFVETEMAAIADADPGIGFVSLHDVFCAEQPGRCRLELAPGHHLYRDRDHLSELGSIWAIDQVERRLGLVDMLRGG